VDVTNHMSQIFSPNTVKEINSVNANGGIRKRCNTYETEDEDNNRPSSTTDSIPVSEAAGSKALAQVMKRSHWKINTSFERKRVDCTKICSICLSDSPVYEDRNQRENLLISPCLCMGIQSHQHKSCIEDLIEQTGAASCPFCFVRYDYTKRRKSFRSYVRDCELEHDFLVSLAAFVFSLYLFLIGASVCYHYVFLSSDEMDSIVGKFPAQTIEVLESAKIWLSTEFDVEKLLDFHHSKSRSHPTRSWLITILFCIVCIKTVLLFVGIVSMSLNMVFRHYVRYWLWSRTHFEVDVRPYDLFGTSG